MALSLTASSHASRVDTLSEAIERALGELVEDHKEPDALYEPVRYILQSGGKRIRPLFVLLSAEIHGRTPQDSMPAAVAVEVFHNFTLVHDDIMDESDERRGRATVHEAWDVSTAILSGDLLLGQAYHLLACLPEHLLAPALNLFHRTMERLCEGQALDKAFEERSKVSVEEYLDMIDRKTGALFRTSLELGPVLGEADENARVRMAEIGFHIGRAFQIQDDLLDLTATDVGWGKPVGEDLIEGKKTYLLVQALETAEGEMLEWLEGYIARGGMSEAAVPEARERFERLGVVEKTRRDILSHYRQALDRLMNVSSHPSVEVLRDILQTLRSRVR